MFSSGNSEDFWAIIRAFTDIGNYRLEWQLLNTSWFLPQNRERIYFIGHLRGKSRPKVFPFRETDQEFNNGTNGATEISSAGQSLQSENGQTEYPRGNTRLNSASSENKNKLKFIGGILGEKNKKWMDTQKNNSRTFPQGQRVYSIDGISAQLTAQGGGWGAKTGLYAIDLYNKKLHSNRTPALTEPHHNSL